MLKSVIRSGMILAAVFGFLAWLVANEPTVHSDDHGGYVNLIKSAEYGDLILTEDGNVYSVIDVKEREIGVTPFWDREIQFRSVNYWADEHPKVLKPNMPEYDKALGDRMRRIVEGRRATQK